MSARDEEREIPIEEGAGEDPGADAEELSAAAGEDPAVATEELERELEREIESLQDRLLRLQAEFDNFRKREARERSAAWGRAKADLAQKLLGALDDLQRVAHLDADTTTASSVIAGISLVERKLSDILAREGLTRIGEPGEPFDPHRHDAISTIPAPWPEQAGLVAAVAVPGYEFGSQLLRPAQVQVYEQTSDTDS